MRSEREGAKLDGGRVTPMSGAGRQKGDYHANGYLIEDKYTDKESFSITLKMLAKTTSEAFAARMLPQWRITMPGVKLRVYREEDALYLEALAARNLNQSAVSEEGS
jgi:hypothetical protein